MRNIKDYAFAINYYHDLCCQISQLTSRPNVTTFGWWGRWGNKLRRKRINQLYVYRAQIYIALTHQGICPIKEGRQQIIVEHDAKE